MLRWSECGGNLSIAWYGRGILVFASDFNGILIVEYRKIIFTMYDVILKDFISIVIGT